MSRMIELSYVMELIDKKSKQAYSLLITNQNLGDAQKMEIIAKLRAYEDVMRDIRKLDT
jgi:hypothetical protein